MKSTPAPLNSIESGTYPILSENRALQAEELATVIPLQRKNANLQRLKPYQIQSQPLRKNKNYDFYMAPRSILPKQLQSSNYLERDGVLIIPEPTPYFYNEKIEYTDEPQTNTERIKIKEYRNRIESVKVSELKQLHPEGTTQIFTYSRQL